MISSPVSRSSVAARSYLTFVVILMLILVAAHFSIQAWGQQQAQQWISAWEKQHDSHVGEIRFHMLRGALTMRDVRGESEGVRFHLSFVLLRGNLFSLINQVDIREVVFQGAEITVSSDIFHQFFHEKMSLAHMLPWASLLDGVKDIHGNDMDITVQAGVNGALPSQPFTVGHASFASAPQQQKWKLSGNIWGGDISLFSQNHEQDMVWSKLDATRLTASLGLTEITGNIHGKSHWQEKKLSGDVAWQRKPENTDKNDVFEGSLVFQGELGKQGWNGNITTVDWPLQIFSAYAPVLHSRKLNSGYLTGKLQIESKKQGWQASMGKGSIQHLDYRSNSDASWYLQHVNFRQTKVLWPQKTLRIHSVDIEQGSWAVDSYEVTTPEPSPIWKVDFPRVSFKAIKLGDITKNIWLSGVQGKLSWYGQRLSMKANSDSKAMGEWKLKAQGIIGKKLELKVQAEHVPLFNFRDALPQTFVKGARLSGDVSLDLSGIWNEAGWQLHGDMDGQDMMWNRGAWLWRAEHMQLENITFSSTQMPHADVWRVYNWLGQSSLTPWFQASNLNASPEIIAPLTLDGWQLKHINIGYGKFSLGQEDAVWFESNTVNFDTVEENQTMKMDVTGRLASGFFTFKADWFPWGETPWVSLHASLKQALPFVAAPWLQLSGLPILTRGRISADVKIDQIKTKPYHYQGEILLNLNYGKLQNGVSSNQMLSEVTGYEAHALFDRINSNGDIHLKIPLQGNWTDRPLSSSVLGQGLLSALAAKASLEVKKVRKKTFVYLSNIRLHDSLDGRSDSLKHNERVRLRKVIRVLKRERKWVLELRPQLGQEGLSEQLMQRVRKTQEQITAFFVSRGISASRIFPVWPEEGNRQGGSTGILIQAVK